MNRFFLCFIVIVCINLALTSSTPPDSMEKAISIMADGKEKVDALNKLSWKYEYNDTKRALIIINTAFELAKKLGYKKGIAQCLNDLGACYSIMGKTEKSLKHFIESLKIKEEINDERGIGISYINIGQIYSDQEQYHKALEYYNKALSQFQKINNQKEIAATFNSIGTLYDKMNKLDSAKTFVERAFAIRKQINDVPGLSESCGNLAVICKHMGDLKTAIKYYELDTKYNEEVGNDYSSTIAMNNLSLLYDRLNDLNKAISTAEKSAEISERKGYLENLKYAFGNLAEFYKKKNDFKTAYHYLSVYFSVYDSLKNESLSNSLNDLALKYETEKKDQQNKLLQIQNDTSLKTIRQQRVFAICIIIGFCLVSLLAFFIFKGLKKQRAANFIISEQKILVENQRDLIEEKQKEILDSIHYARRIQNALITSEKYIERNLTKLQGFK